ncbi:unnamed protein product, partial [Ectocarpus sp. 12 AP-2014]
PSSPPSPPLPPSLPSSLLLPMPRAPPRSLDNAPLLGALRNLPVPARERSSLPRSPGTSTAAVASAMAGAKLPSSVLSRPPGRPPSSRTSKSVTLPASSERLPLPPNVFLSREAVAKLLAAAPGTELAPRSPAGSASRWPSRRRQRCREGADEGHHTIGNAVPVHFHSISPAAASLPPPQISSGTCAMVS